MSGVKGQKSGRNWNVEVNIRKLANMAIGWTERSWNTLDSDQKLKVVCALAPKYITQQMEHSGDGCSVVILKYAKD